MDNRKTLKIGRSDFELIVKNNHYFVDKTMLIYDFYHNENDIVLMPRPKRFGKTLNLSMIEHFFDIRKSKSEKLFSEFEISKKIEFCQEHQNKYPLINISLKKVKATNWESCLNSFKIAISKLYKEHKYLLKSEKLDDFEKDNFKKILYRTATKIEYANSLVELSEYLKAHFDNEVIILVDEYDAPIITAFNNTNSPIKSIDKENLTYYQNVIDFMQTFLGEAYKENKNLKKGLLTGVMRVGRESIFSEWNNFDVFGITSTYFSNSFGFTQQETKKILTFFGLQNDINKVAKWYDGYKFGNTVQIYNPWSIVSYISKVNDGFKPYWINTGDYSLIKESITAPDVKNKIQELIEGKTIEKELKDNFVFSDFEIDNELIWTLLTYNGYLTQVGKGKFGNYKLKIPNKEVKIVFTDIIMNWLNTKVKIKRDLLISTAESLINNEIIKFEKGFRQIIGDTISYFDTASKNIDTMTSSHRISAVTPEQIYHVYTLGLLAILSDDYIIKSNRESGNGRYDIMLIPQDKTNISTSLNAKNGIVIEIKQIEKQKENEDDKKFSERVNNKIDDAMSQIDRNEYYAELIVNQIKPENIIKLAIVFVGKKPYINKLAE